MDAASANRSSFLERRRTVARRLAAGARPRANDDDGDDGDDDGDEDENASVSSWSDNASSNDEMSDEDMSDNDPDYEPNGRPVGGNNAVQGNAVQGNAAPAPVQGQVVAPQMQEVYVEGRPAGTPAGQSERDRAYYAYVMQLLEAGFSYSRSIVTQHGSRADIYARPMPPSGN